jgi:DNA-binding winged helix-turn-helix (wHTH) protein
MEDQRICLYEFGPYRLDPVKRVLRCGDKIVPLKPKPLDALIVLIESAPRVLLKDELMQALWPDTIVEENNLTQCISVLRRALGESRADHNFILTVPGRGYQFVADVRRTETPDFISPVLQSRPQPEPGPEILQESAPPKTPRVGRIGLAVACLAALFGIMYLARFRPAQVSSTATAGGTKSMAVVFYSAGTLPDNDRLAPWTAAAVIGGVSLSDGMLLFRDTRTTVSLYQRNEDALRVGASWTMEFRANYQSGSLWLASLSELSGRWVGICFVYDQVTDCGGLGPGSVSSTSGPFILPGIDPRGWHVWRVEKDGLKEVRIYKDDQLIHAAPYAQLPMAMARKGAAVFGAGGTAMTAVVDLDYFRYSIGPLDREPGNNAPIAILQQVTTSQDTARKITLTGNDREGDNLTFATVDPPQHGSLTGTAPALTYTPASDFDGPDRFTFKVNDGRVDSEPESIYITVTPVSTSRSRTIARP